MYFTNHLLRYTELCSQMFLGVSLRKKATYRTYKRPSKFGIAVALMPATFPVFFAVARILKAGYPLKVFWRIVSPIAIDVVYFVLRTWSISLEGGYNKPVRPVLLPLGLVGEGKKYIPTTILAGL